jgi:6-phosphogluconate dehydrogenase
MDLQAPLSVIDTAVTMRDLSKYKALRTTAAAWYTKDSGTLHGDPEQLISALEASLYFATIVAYAQGMHLLSQASQEFRYELKMDQIALIWRGGCIIRSAFLEDIHQAYRSDAQLLHLLVDPNIRDKVIQLIPDTRKLVGAAIASGIAMPAHAAALSYFDTLRSERMPSNLIQAQRDFFGAHTYERIGKEGVFHTQWLPK